MTGSRVDSKTKRGDRVPEPSAHCQLYDSGRAILVLEYIDGEALRGPVAGPNGPARRSRLHARWNRLTIAASAPRLSQPNVLITRDGTSSSSISPGELCGLQGKTLTPQHSGNTMLYALRARPATCRRNNRRANHSTFARCIQLGIVLHDCFRVAVGDGDVSIRPGRPRSARSPRCPAANPRERFQTMAR